MFFKEDILKESEQLPNLVKTSLEKGKIKENDWNDEIKLPEFINDCINIENNLKNINIIVDKIKAFNSNKYLRIEFNPRDEELDKKLNDIKVFGGIKINIDNNVENI